MKLNEVKGQLSVFDYPEGKKAMEEAGIPPFEEDSKDN